MPVRGLELCMILLPHRPSHLITQQILLLLLQKHLLLLPLAGCLHCQCLVSGLHLLFPGMLQWFTTFSLFATSFFLLQSLCHMSTWDIFPQKTNRLMPSSCWKTSCRFSSSPFITCYSSTSLGAFPIYHKHKLEFLVLVNCVLHQKPGPFMLCAFTLAHLSASYILDFFFCLT